MDFACLPQHSPPSPASPSAPSRPRRGRHPKLDTLGGSAGVACDIRVGFGSGYCRYDHSLAGAARRVIPVYLRRCGVRLRLALALSPVAWPREVRGQTSECSCSQYRCERDGVSYVYAPTDMLEAGALECVQSKPTVYTSRGDCRYCEGECANSVCDCKGQLVCDWLSIASVVVCFTIALVLMCVAVHVGRKHYKRAKTVTWERDIVQPIKKWEQDFRVCVVLPCVSSLVLICGGIALIVGRSSFT